MTHHEIAIDFIRVQVERVMVHLNPLQRAHDALVAGCGSHSGPDQHSVQIGGYYFPKVKNSHQRKLKPDELAVETTDGVAKFFKLDELIKFIIDGRHLEPARAVDAKGREDRVKLLKLMGECDEPEPAEPVYYGRCGVELVDGVCRNYGCE